MAGELQAASARAHGLSHGPESRQYVVLVIGEQMFGVDVMLVQDVLRRQRIARIPLAPEVVAGLLNLRGRIVTAMDMRIRLNMPPIKDNRHIMNVVIEHRGELFSLVVDSVGEVLTLPVNKIEKTPANLSEQWRALSHGVYKLDGKLLVILDVNQVIGLKREPNAA